MRVKPNVGFTIQYSLRWSNRVEIDLRKQTGISFILSLPDDTTVRLTSCGYDAFRNKVWVRIPAIHTVQEGQYKGVLSVMTKDLQMVSTGLHVIAEVDSDASGVYQNVLLSLDVTSIDTPVNMGQGYSPKIVNGEWVVFDDSQQAYVPTGQSVVATEYVDNAVAAEAEARQQGISSLESSLSSEVSRAQAKEAELQEAVEEVADIIGLNEVRKTADDLSEGYYYTGREVGSTISDTIQAHGSLKCIKVPVMAGQSIIVYTIGGGNGRAWCLTDANRVSKSVSESNADYSSTPFTADITEDGYLYVNCTSTGISHFSIQVSGGQTRIDEIESDVTRLSGEVASAVLSADYAKEEIDGTEDSTVSKNVATTAGVAITANQTKIAVSVQEGDTLRLELRGDAVVGTGIVIHYWDASAVEHNWLTGQSQDVTIVAPDNMTFVSFYLNGTYVVNDHGVTAAVTVIGTLGLIDRVSSLESDSSSDYVGLPALDDTNPLANLLRGMGTMAAIKEWGAIGASYESGVSEYKNTGGTYGSRTYREFYSWPQILGRLNQVYVQNFTIPGGTIKDWCQSANANGWGNGTVGASANPKQAYTIVISSNDADATKFQTYSGGIGSLSTDIMPDYTNNPDTFAGWLAGTIQRLRSISPHSFVFVSTIRKMNGSAATLANRTAINQAIRNLVQYFDNLYVLDLGEYGIDFNNADVKSAFMVGSHLSSLGYLMIAYQINTYIDYHMRKHASEFKYAQFVGDDSITDINWGSY